jgi:hypothetical protein
MDPSHHQLSIVSALLLGLLIWSDQCYVVRACQVLNAVGVDVTSDFFLPSNSSDSTTPTSTSSSTTTSTEPAPMVVQCVGTSACANFTMNNCPTIHCEGHESCFGATALDVTERVECLDVHSCHRAHVLFALPPSSPTGTTTTNTVMLCHGEGACDVTFIHGVDLLDCFGHKACRKVDVQANTVLCRRQDGSSADTCMDLATFTTPCLYCQESPEACSPHINQCRYQLPLELRPEPSSNDDDEEPPEWIECDTDPSVLEHCTKEQMETIRFYQDNHDRQR